MTTLKSECRKFSPNIFNKTKCQNCFRTKDTHSAEALESNRSTRKVSKCGYLFVAPDWDFSVSINRTKRWQRRWFVLYDDGELTYSVDEHPDTVPQAVIDMNKVLEVSDAQEITGNQFAIAITAPEKVHFIKGTSREESRWWFDVLNRLPRNNLRHGKHKRNATFPGGKATTSNVIPDHGESNLAETYSAAEEDGPVRPRFTSESIICQREDDDWMDWLHQHMQEDDVFPTKEYSLKNVTPAVIPASINDKEDAVATDKKLVKKEEDTSEKSGEDAKKGRCRRYQKRENRNLRSQRSRSDGVAKMIPSRDLNLDENLKNGVNHSSLDDRLNSPVPVRRRHTSDKVFSCSEIGQKVELKQALVSNLLTSSTSTNRSLKKSESLMNISSDLSPEMKHHISELKRNHSYKGTVYSKKDLPKETSCSSFIQPVRDAPSKLQVNNNEVQNDSCSSWDAGIDICTEGMVLKKGWLMRRPTLFSKDEWSRHWFVLKNASFTYYRDPSAEDCGILDGVLDLNQVTSVECLETEKYFAFSLIMWDNKKHVLSTVSSAARSSWIKAIQCASNLWDAESRRDFSNDEIVLPEHNFNTSEVPEHSFATCEKSTEQTQDMSSSDDQSEYFSIIDDGEDEVGAGERPSSPRTLPPSPPLSRTPMSLVKERSRGRSNSYSCSSVATTNDDSAVEQEVSESHGDVTDCSQDMPAKLNERNFEEENDRDQDFSEKINKESKSLRKQNSHEHFKQYELEKSEDKIFDSDEFEKLSHMYQNLSDPQLLNLLNGDEVDLTLDDNVDIDNYKVKYEYLKAKYVQDQMDWESKMKKEKASSLKSNSLNSYIKILQKTKRSVNELNEKFCGSSPNNQGMYVVAAKSLQQLNKELERISPYSEKRLKREGELKKWKKGFDELQHLCKNLQKNLQEEQNRNSVLVLELKKKERAVEELEQEIHSFKKEQLFSSQRYQENCASQNLDAPDDMPNICKKLADKLKMADEQVRQIKKDLKDSHRNFDDLEIYCFQLKQDVKLSEENHQSQMALMTARVDDLTSKLTTSERNLRQIKQKLTKLESKQERRRSSLKNKEAISLSKEYESKLCDLEQKLTSIENELRFEGSFPREEMSSNNGDCEKVLGKSLSQDSNCSAGGENMLLRLHNLSLRTKIANETVKKQAHLNISESGDVFDKPKICLQVKSEEETMEHEEEEECGEDWSTLSYATSLTDLQTFDGLDSCEFPNSWPEISECLDEKLESLLCWLKFSIHGLLKQETVDAQNGGNADFAVLSSNILEAADSLSDTRVENTSQTKFQPSKVCYKMLLLNEVTRAMQKIVNFESCLVLEKLCVCQPCFKFMLTHAKYLSSTENQSSADILNCFSLIEKSFSVSCSTYDAFLNDCLEDFAQVSQQSPNRLLLLQQNCVHLVKLLDDVKSRQFSAIMQTLADIPVQDPDVNSESSTLHSEDLFELDPLLLNIITIVSQFYKVAEYQLYELHQQGLSLLQCDHKVWAEWTTVLHNSLKAELCSVIEEIKASYPQVREKNIFPCSLSTASYKKIIYGSVALTRISLLRILIRSILTFLSDESVFPSDNIDSKEWLMRLRDGYSSKASSFCEVNTINFNSDFFENLCLDHILETGIREIKIESVFHDIHKKKIESMHKELDTLISENGKLKLTCEEKDAQLHDLRSKLEQIVTKESCKECHSLRTKLQSVKQSHETELVAVDKKYKDKMEEIHKHLQLVLEQKDDIHSQEVQKLEAQLEASQKISSRLELEYNQQVQHLKELYQHKMCMAGDPINEESVRKRYQSEIEQLKDLWEKGLAAVQNSYQQMTMELDMRHKQELSMLEAEKEKVLKEETQATIAALEVIRKYHAEELQREIVRYKKEILDRFQANNQMEISHDKRLNELDDVKHEIMMLSERYSVKCLENASLEEKVQSLQRQLNETNHQLFDVTARNKQLMIHLAIDIEKIKQCLDANESSDGSLENLKILLKLKESEIAEQKEVNAQSKQELHLAQMHVSVLDVQCEQLYQSLNAERKLREDEVNNLRSRLEAIITASLVHADESTLKCSEVGGRNKLWNTRQNLLCRTPSLTLIPGQQLDKINISCHDMTQTTELLKSPSWPVLEPSK